MFDTWLFWTVCVAGFTLNAPDHPSFNVVSHDKRWLCATVPLDVLNNNNYNTINIRTSSETYMPMVKNNLAMPTCDFSFIILVLGILLP